MVLNVVIDISHYQTITDNSFVQVYSAGIHGVIHKVTEGTSYVDGEYAPRQPMALEAGLMFGAYHFGRHGDALGQAHHFLDIAQPTPETLLVLDWESCGANPDMTLDEAEQFVRAIADELGRYPGLYSGESFCGDALAGVTDTVLSQCWLWLAKYSEQMPAAPAPWAYVSMWQYTDGVSGPKPHEVPGIGRCDRDMWNGSEEGLRRLWGVEQGGSDTV